MIRTRHSPVLKRPHVTLKLATSLDGKIALANGQSEWITGEKARAEGRKLRARHDGIVIGANTAVLDNPQLTTRIPGAPDPIRIVFDTHLRLPRGSNLTLTAQETPVWIFCASDQGPKADILKSMGVLCLPISVRPHLDVTEALEILREKGVSRLLIEGGGTLAASFLSADVIDVIEWFRAPMILGGDGRSCIGNLGYERLDLAKRFNRAAISELGDDVHERYERRAG